VSTAVETELVKLRPLVAELRQRQPQALDAMADGERASLERLLSGNGSGGDGDSGSIAGSGGGRRRAPAKSRAERQASKLFPPSSVLSYPPFHVVYVRKKKCGAGYIH
jgi:hypothetical protein